MEEASKEGGAVAAPVAADPEDPSHALLHLPVNVRSMTLVVITILIVLATLKWASAFFIPLMLGLMRGEHGHEELRPPAHAHAEHVVLFRIARRFGHRFRVGAGHGEHV